MNPALGSDCSGLKPNYYYCVATFTKSPMPPIITGSPSPTQSGIIPSCKSYYQAIDGDTCDFITTIFGTFSQSEFLGWNPALKANCSGLVPGDYYCVGIPGTPNTRTNTQKGPISTTTSSFIVRNATKVTQLNAPPPSSGMPFSSPSPTNGNWSWSAIPSSTANSRTPSLFQARSSDSSTTTGGNSSSRQSWSNATPFSGNVISTTATPSAVQVS